MGFVSKEKRRLVVLFLMLTGMVLVVFGFVGLLDQKSSAISLAVLMLALRLI